MKNILQIRSLAVIISLLIMLFTGCNKEDSSTNPHHDHSLPPVTDTNTNVIIDSTIPSSHLLYVADEKSGTISVVRPGAGKRIMSIALSPTNVGLNMLMPHNVQVAPDGKSVWVTAVPMKLGEMEQIVIINPLTNKITNRIEVGRSLHLAHIVFDQDTKYAFATATDAGLLIQFDASSFKEIKRFNLRKDSKPHGLRYFNGKLFIANMGNAAMTILDVEKESLTEIPLGGKAVQTAITQDGKFAFASLYDTKEVIRYDIQAGQLTRIPLPASAQGPMQLYPTPDNKQLYVCDQGVLDGRLASNEVYVIDIKNASVSAIIKVGKAAHGVVISNDGKTAYITNAGENSVSIINIATQKVKGTIMVGAAPNGISYWYETGGMP